MAALAAMFTFAACGGDDATNEGNTPAPGTKTQLAQPVVEVVAQTEDSFTISWNAVSGATEYLVYLDKNNQPKTTETTYTFTDLNAGTYKPRVKAIGGDKYKDSEYSAVIEITVAGASSVNWFTQTVGLPEDSAELAAKGINSSNTVVFNWQGDGVEALSYMYFFNDDDFAAMTEDQIVAEMYALDAETLAYVNTAEGIDLQFTDMAGDTEYVLCAYVVKAGKTFLDKKVVKTNPTILTLGTQAWLGNWTATTSQLITIPTDENGLTNYAVTDQTTEHSFTVTPYNEYYSNYVWVDGLSVLGKEAPAFGQISHEKVVNADKTGYEYTGNYVLELMCYETIGQLAEDIWAVWLPLATKGTSGYTFVSGSFPGFTFVLNPTTGAVTCISYSGTLNDNSAFEVKMMDIFGLNPSTGNLYLMSADDESTIDTYYWGGFQNVAKAAAAASTASVAPKAMKVSSVAASVVVAM